MLMKEAIRTLEISNNLIGKLCGDKEIDGSYIDGYKAGIGIAINILNQLYEQQESLNIPNIILPYITYECDCGWSGACPKVFSDPMVGTSECWNHYICPECNSSELKTITKDFVI